MAVVTCHIFVDGWMNMDMVMLKNDKQSYVSKNIRESSSSNEHYLIESSLSFWFY